MDAVTQEWALFNAGLFLGSLLMSLVALGINASWARTCRRLLSGRRE